MNDEMVDGQVSKETYQAPVIQTIGSVADLTLGAGTKGSDKGKGKGS